MENDTDLEIEDLVSLLNEEEENHDTTNQMQILESLDSAENINEKNINLADALLEHLSEFDSSDNENLIIDEEINCSSKTEISENCILESQKNNNSLNNMNEYTFDNSSKSIESYNNEKLVSNNDDLIKKSLSTLCTANEGVTEMELELQKMQEKMNKLKDKIIKQKKLNTSSTGKMSFTKLSAPISVNEKIKETSRILIDAEKKKIFDQIHKSESEIHTGETDSEDDDDNRSPPNARLSLNGREMKKNIAHLNKSKNHSSDQSLKKNSLDSSLNKRSLTKNLNSVSQNFTNSKESNFLSNKRSISMMNDEDSTPYIKDPFSGIRIIKPLVSEELLKDMVSGRKVIKLSTILFKKNQIKDIDEDWVTMGVVVCKSETKISKKGSQYTILQLSDLNDCTKIVSLFLFSKAYINLWKKIIIGSVIGVLNSEVMDDSSKPTDGRSVCALAVNTSEKILHMGTSKDFGFCKGRKKEGTPCRQFVNTNVCTFCMYHIQSEYRKMSSNRPAIQSSFSRVDPRAALQNKILGKDNVFYGGQLYGGNLASTHSRKKLTPANKPKDLSTLASLNTKLKVEQLKKNENTLNKLQNNDQINNNLQVNQSNDDLTTSFSEKEGKIGDKLQINNIQSLKTNKYTEKGVNKNKLQGKNKIRKLQTVEKMEKNEALSEMLMVPTPGARNLLALRAKSLETKNKDKKSKKLKKEHSETDSLGSAKQFLNTNKCLTRPKLGRGLSSDSIFEIELTNQNKSYPTTSNQDRVHKRAKAVQILQKSGRISPIEQNMARNLQKCKNEKFQENIKNKLKNAFELKNKNKIKKRNDETNADDNADEKKELPALSNKRGSLLGSIDLNSKEFQKILNAKSSHTNLIENEEDERVENYYKSLEKKEMLENKMAAISEVPVSAAICLKCKYKAISVSELCKSENHPLKFVKATKRFFQCKNCKRRKISLEKLPTKSCDNCNENSWTRVSMGKEKKGPKLECEILSLRGDELKHYSSAGSKIFLNIN